MYTSWDGHIRYLLWSGNDIVSTLSMHTLSRLNNRRIPKNEIIFCLYLILKNNISCWYRIYKIEIFMDFSTLLTYCWDHNNKPLHIRLNWILTLFIHFLSYGLYLSWTYWMHKTSCRPVFLCWQYLFYFLFSSTINLHLN